MLKVGDVVYEAYNPRFVGRVVEVYPRGTRKLQVFSRRGKEINWRNGDIPSRHVDVRVQWQSGFETDEPLHLLNLLGSLIYTHAKRLKAHRERYARALINIQVPDKSEVV